MKWFISPYYAKIVLKGSDFMLSQDTNIRFYSHPQMCKLPINMQGEIMEIFEDILTDVKEENSNVTVSELFYDNQSRE